MLTPRSIRFPRSITPWITVSQLGSSSPLEDVVDRGGESGLVVSCIKLSLWCDYRLRRHVERDVKWQIYRIFVSKHFEPICFF